MNSGEARWLPRFACAAILCLLAGCGVREADEANTDPQDTVLAAFIQRESGADAADVNPGLRRELEARFAQLRAAATLGANIEQAQPRIELARLELQARAAAEAAGVFAQPSEDEVQRAYAEFVHSQPATEYHVAHILVATETLAREALIEVQSGRPFADVASARSTDTSRAYGGDLGWVRKGALPTPLLAAIEGLQPGQYAAAPIQTPYGWHVVQLLDERAIASPPLEQVRDQLVVNLQQQRYQAFLADSTRPTGNRND